MITHEITYLSGMTMQSLLFQLIQVSASPLPAFQLTKHVIHRVKSLSNSNPSFGI